MLVGEESHEPLYGLALASCRVPSPARCAVESDTALDTELPMAKSQERVDSAGTSKLLPSSSSSVEGVLDWGRELVLTHRFSIQFWRPMVLGEQDSLRNPGCDKGVRDRFRSSVRG